MLLIISFNCYRVYNIYQDKQEYLDYLKQKTENVMLVVDKIDKKEFELGKLNKKINSLKEELSPNYCYLPWLDRLSSYLTVDTVIKELIIEDNKLIILKGNSKSATVLMKDLKKSEFFTNLHFSGSINIEESREDFQIAGDLTGEIIQERE